MPQIAFRITFLELEKVLSLNAVSCEQMQVILRKSGYFIDF